MNIKRFRQILTDPILASRYLNRGIYRLRNRKGFYQQGTDFMAEDWDNLLILDACRFDTFCERNILSGCTESRLSRAASTPEFVRSNLDGKTLHDTVYVTANSQLHAQSDVSAEFHDEINIWQEEWDNDLGAPPNVVSEHARQAAKEYPNKRLLVHYIQPHLPFLSEQGRKIHKIHNSNIDDNTSSIWLDKLRGALKITNDELWTAYKENLDCVLESVDNLLPDLEGKTVVTADHGQLIGERVKPIPIREYGHPTGIYHERLVQVPWHIHEFEYRRDIISEQPVLEKRDPSEEVVHDRLEQLGYLT